MNEDINRVLDKAEAGEFQIPDVDMVVGGFPCQDYSVARPLNQAHGIEGKKGVLWWDIYHFLEMKEPRFGLFENVDRLLKSPASQRGRDFAIILSCLADLGYTVEWRVVNSAEYGFPQRRKRVYIFCEKDAGDSDLTERMRRGVMAKAFPAVYPDEMTELDVLPDPYENSTRFGVGQKVSQFKTAGVMQGCHVLTCDFAEDYHASAECYVTYWWTNRTSPNSSTSPTRSCPTGATSRAQSARSAPTRRRASPTPTPRAP